VNDDRYARLSAPFPERRDPRGNPYIHADDAIARLNVEFGVDGWNFQVLQHGIEWTEGEVWVLGELEFLVAPPAEGEKAYWSKVQQFGGHKIQRFRQGDNAGKPLDLGNDLQSAATDALKKCCKLRGMGLHLKAGQQGSDQQQQVLRCDECNDQIGGVGFKNGSTWTAAQLASEGQKRYRQKLCRTHYFERARSAA
jgi:hypothetical protein